MNEERGAGAGTFPTCSPPHARHAPGAADGISRRDHSRPGRGPGWLPGMRFAAALGGILVSFGKIVDRWEGPVLLTIHYEEDGAGLPGAPLLALATCYATPNRSMTGANSSANGACTV